MILTHLQVTLDVDRIGTDIHKQKLNMPGTEAGQPQQIRQCSLWPRELNSSGLGPVILCRECFQGF